MRARREQLLPWGFLLPSAAILGLITLYPLLYAIVLSFKQGSFIEVGGFAGIDNYSGLFEDGSLFPGALRFSAIFTVLTVAGSYALGLGFALAVHRVRRGRWLLRMGLLTPWVVPPVVAVIAWRWMVNDDGSLVNQALGVVGIDPVAFLSDPFWASVMVILLRIWRTFPFVFLTLFAARQGVSDELYEAAALDGSTGFSAFRRITLPQLAPVSIVSSLLVAIWSFNDFESIFLLTRGGPSNATYNLVVLGYYEAFFGNDVGLAAAMGVVALVLLLVLSVVLLRLLRRVNET
ncbi:carbohydrate ABC transporter permease [Conexibacter woesei]|uniref:Binding-protein-dependent transport systems inner membrane component n=1 Tax=Conexibacter woesei (strain DSM 14684 / CCUG 47730 / CIP 108061 / JCM 11494 / NBRC 100937 / ID131577) TaxID=469383 RepID=D3FDB3_CONWI|nr:sugar ABC transporter permease [Conexibacter woesei]ADB53505.1 binding-protein-dependent transport systems inner membrane component [Conexibacter woesei DSM 14684]